MLWEITAIVFIAGCVGGSVTGLVALESSRSSNNNGTQSKNKERQKLGIAYKNLGCDTVFAGLAGHVLLGGIAALVYWGLYGPFSGICHCGCNTTRRRSNGAVSDRRATRMFDLARYWWPCFLAGRIAATL